MVKNKTFKILNYTKSLIAYILVNTSEAFLDDVAQETHKQYDHLKVIPVQGHKLLHIITGRALMNTSMTDQDYAGPLIKWLEKSNIDYNGLLLFDYDANINSKNTIKTWLLWYQYEYGNEDSTALTKTHSVLTTMLAFEY